MTWLERHDDAENIHRFCALDVNRDLFGDWLLIRRWGRVSRIGQKGGQSRVQVFASYADAIAAGQKLTRSKTRRGYA